jgi:hypothetical protein
MNFANYLQKHPSENGTYIPPETLPPETEPAATGTEPDETEV